MQPFRSTFVIVLAGLEVVLAGLVIYAGISVLLLPSYVGPDYLAEPISVTVLLEGAILVVLGLTNLALAALMWVGRGLAWTAGLILGIVEILGAAYSIALGVSIDGAAMIVLNLVVIYFLVSPPVRAFFGRGHPKTS